MSELKYYNTCNNEYDTSTGIYTPLVDGKVSFQGNILFDIIYTESNANTTYQLNHTRDPLNGTSVRFQAFVQLFLMEKDGGTFNVKERIRLYFSDNALSTPLTASTTISDNEYSFSTGEISVIAGNEYYLSVGSVVYDADIRYLPPYPQTPYNYFYNNFSDFQFRMLQGSTFGSVSLDKELRVGDTMQLNSTIPKNIKQSELLSSIIKRFNLYIDYDPIDENKLIIETREDYLTEDRVDIEHLVDRSREYKIKPMGALDAGRFIFKDQLDKDYLNDAYNKVNDEVYGQLTLDVDNDFLNKDKEITTIFAPTPLETFKGENDRVLSSIRFVNQNGEKADATAKIRLLYWGGTLATQKQWVLSGALQNTYPYAGHLDNPFDPQFDLNWWIPAQLYYDFSYGNKYTLFYPDNNCYNAYWKKYIEEITDKNSKILECYLALRPYDYNELSFRKSYYIDGSYWRLLKVTDFDAIAEETTKCLFLKVEPKSTFVPTRNPLSGGIDIYDGDRYPTDSMIEKVNGNTGKVQDSIQYGDNVKGGTRSLVASNNVEMSLDSKNSLLVGSNNAQSFADNTTMLNSPFVSTIRDGESYINNVFVEKQISINLSNDTLNNLTGELEILPPLPADEFYQITRGYVRLIGDAALGGTHKVDLVTDDAEEHLLAEIPSAFFSVNNNVGYLTLGAHTEADIHFGSGVKITSNNLMEFAGSNLRINLIYRIIKI